jgi:glutamyl-tRNA reductase
MPLVAVGLSHKTAPVEIRERMAFAEADLAAAAGRIRALGLATEALVVSTCNRVELYAASPAGDPAALAQQLRGFLLRDRGYTGDASGTVYTHLGTAALEHLFRVVSGLDSLVLGETEILGQIKRFYSLALSSGHTGGILNRSFQRAFAMAKRIRTETQIQRGNTSVAAVAVELAERIFDDLDRRQVLVIGAGNSACDVAVESARLASNVGLANSGNQHDHNGPKRLL